MKAKNLQQNASFFLPRIDFPFVTSILLCALKTHTALPQQQSERFPHPARSVVLFLSFQRWERRDFRCKNHCSGKRRKRTKATAEVIARWAHAKAKSGGDKMRCRMMQSAAYVVCFALPILVVRALVCFCNGARTGGAKKSPNQKRTRPYPVSAQNETGTL